MENNVRSSFDLESRARLDRLSRRGNVTQNVLFYSRFILFMRFLLPVVSLVIIVLVFVRMGGGQGGDVIIPVKLDDQGIDEKQNYKNELVNPTFESTDKKGNPYKITADRAVHGEENKNLVMLEHPNGSMTMNDGGVLHVKASQGAYRQDTQRFFLEGGVVLNHSQGYRLESEQAQINIAKEFVWSDVAVNGSGPDIKISAAGLRVNGRTGVVVFKGPAVLILDKGFEGFQ